MYSEEIHCNNQRQDTKNSSYVTVVRTIYKQFVFDVFLHVIALRIISIIRKSALLIVF